jgi:hypothetical protein
VAEEITAPEFWDNRYASNKTPWDLGKSPERLSQFLLETKPASVLIPGFGRGYEIVSFIDAGWQVTSIEISIEAIALARDLLGKRRVEMIHGDYFTYPFFSNSFDFIYERAFLCALPMNLREEYSKRAYALLKSSGSIAGIFLYGERKDTPPYPLRNDEGLKLFSSFKLVKDETLKNSIEVFKGMERWQEWKKV